MPRRAREAAVVARRKRFGKQTLNVNPKLLLNKGRVLVVHPVRDYEEEAREGASLRPHLAL